MNAEEETTAAGWRLHVDPTRCIGVGICAGAAPEHFVLVEGLSRPVADRVAPAPAVIYAADSCPMEAILVSDVDTRRRIAPGS
ncbi:ferredoxin [Micromonospora sp. RTGN7]|uniref:ferredoxin n=1 Tax=Micromonospora sp. RTGN7 TaxID=3016526 RepID=UPI0029FEEE36|nr:ferredoxin [Micromonospora sp. RTGN7]